MLFAPARKLCECFWSDELQPSNASDTCSDVETQNTSKHIQWQVVREKIKIKNKHLYEHWDPHGIALAYVYYTDDWIPST